MIRFGVTRNVPTAVPWRYSLVIIKIPRIKANKYPPAALAKTALIPSWVSVPEKAEEDAGKKKQEQKPESAETLLAELNNKMATLLKYTFTVAHNTNETVSATRGLNNNLLKR